jgi:hypothetical protein
MKVKRPSPGWQQEITFVDKLRPVKDVQILSCKLKLDLFKKNALLTAELFLVCEKSTTKMV